MSVGLSVYKLRSQPPLPPPAHYPFPSPAPNAEDDIRYFVQQTKCSTKWGRNWNKTLPHLGKISNKHFLLLRFKGAESRLNGFKSLENFFQFCCLSSIFSILNHPLSLYGILLSLWCFSIFVKYYFQVSFSLMVILLMIKITQNTVTVLFYSKINCVTTGSSVTFVVTFV